MQVIVCVQIPKIPIPYAVLKTDFPIELIAVVAYGRIHALVCVGKYVIRFVCVYVYLCVYVCVSVWVYVCEYVCVGVGVWVCVCVCVCVWLDMCGCNGGYK